MLVHQPLEQLEMPDPKNIAKCGLSADISRLKKKNNNNWPVQNSVLLPPFLTEVLRECKSREAEELLIKFAKAMTQFDSERERGERNR